MYAAAGILILAALVGVYSGGSPGWWQLPVFGLGPDVAFLLSLDASLERGRMRPRAVHLYNLLHRPLLPLALGVLVAVGVAPASLTAGALAWGLHIALDRTLGYGLRGADGWRR